MKKLLMMALGSVLTAMMLSGCGNAEEKESKATQSPKVAATILSYDTRSLDLNATVSNDTENYILRVRSTISTGNAMGAWYCDSDNNYCGDFTQVSCYETSYYYSTYWVCDVNDPYADGPYVTGITLDDISTKIIMEMCDSAGNCEQSEPLAWVGGGSVKPLVEVAEPVEETDASTSTEDDESTGDTIVWIY